MCSLATRFFAIFLQGLVLTVVWSASPENAYAQSDKDVPYRVFVLASRSHLRSGPGSQFEAVGVVSSGQELEVVTTEDDWLRVVSATGKPGWIARRATTTNPPTPVVVKNLEKKIEVLQSENTDLTKEFRRLSDARQDLELETSKLRTQVETLQVQNEELQSWRTILWVIIGLVILLTGWFLGFLAGVFRRQADDKRYNALIKEAASKKI